MIARCVLLRHTLPDGAAHIDWLLEREAGEEGLLTFRLAERPDRAGRLVAQQLPDHRRAYLEFEGEVSGGRGRVDRLGAGECVVDQPAPDLLRVRFRFRSAWFLAQGRRLAPETWDFAVAEWEPPMA